MGLRVYVDGSSHPFLPGADISGDWDGIFHFWISDCEGGVFAWKYFCLRWDLEEVRCVYVRMYVFMYGDCSSYVSFCSCLEIVAGSRWGLESLNYLYSDSDDIAILIHLQ